MKLIEDFAYACLAIIIVVGSLYLAMYGAGNDAAYHHCKNLWQRTQYQWQYTITEGCEIKYHGKWRSTERLLRRLEHGTK